jgi:hypothetical protein
VPVAVPRLDVSQAVGLNLRSHVAGVQAVKELRAGRLSQPDKLTKAPRAK